MSLQPPSVADAVSLPRFTQRWRCILAGLVAFALAAVIYVRTAAPSLGLGHDTGELTCDCVSLGVAHAPGYPLYVAMGHLASLIPYGEIAWRLNVFSSITLACGVGLLATALALVTSPVCGFSAALLFATATAVWRQGVVAEVFALHLCITCALILAVTVWEQGNLATRRICFILCCTLVGLAFSHHHTVALIIPVLLVFGMLSKGDGHWGMSPLAFVAFFACATLPYAFMMYLAKQKPLMNWGDASDLSRLWAHILRKAYGTGALNPAGNDVTADAGLSQAATYFVNVLRNQYPIPAGLVILLGIDTLITRRNHKYLFLYSGIALVNGPAFAILGNQPTALFFADLMDRFYASSLVGLAGLLAFGFHGILSYQWPGSKSWPRWSRQCSRWVLTALILLLPSLSYHMNYEKADQHTDYDGRDLMEVELACFPKGSVFVVDGDLTSGVSDYIRVAEGRRQDLVSILPGLIGTDWFNNNLPTKIAEAVNKQGQRTDQKDAASHENVLTAVLAYAYKAGYPVCTNYRPDPNKIKGKFFQAGPVFRYYPEDHPDLTKADELAEHRRVLDLMTRMGRRGPERDSWKLNFWSHYCFEMWVKAYAEMADFFLDKDPRLAIRCVTAKINLEENPTNQDHLVRAQLLERLGKPLASRNELIDIYENHPERLGIINYLIDLCHRQHWVLEERRWRIRSINLQREYSNS